MKLAERLNDQITKLENQVEALKEELARRDYKDSWEWRQIKELTAEENGDLPVPRLEIRSRKLSDYEKTMDYGLVYYYQLSEEKVVTFVPISSTRTNGTLAGEEFRLPIKDGICIKNDMKQLNLRGFVINLDGKAQEIKL